jgi:hypothetical protein
LLLALVFAVAGLAKLAEPRLPDSEDS